MGVENVFWIVLLYLIVGMFIGVNYILANGLQKSATEVKSGIMYGWVVKWPIHGACWIGMKILSMVK